MKNKIFSIALILLFSIMSYGQVNSKIFIPPDGSFKIYFATSAMTDSTGSQYSQWYDVNGFLPKDLYTYPLFAAVSGTGTADSVAVIIKGRNLIPGSSKVPQYTKSVALDTIIVSFNHVDTVAYYYNSGINLNGATPDQIRIQVKGQSTVNRSDVVIKTWLTLINQSYYYLLK